MAAERVDTNVHIKHFVLKQNRNFPNSEFPVLKYEKVISLPMQKKKAVEIARRILLRNGWRNSWVNGIYDFHHYHSNIHECMLICAGSANVILGGPGGRKIRLTTGDVLILPAGTGHRCISSSRDFCCVGAYPRSIKYDMKMGVSEELKDSLLQISKVPVPRKDPVFGKEGFLKMHWK